MRSFRIAAIVTVVLLLLLGAFVVARMTLSPETDSASTVPVTPPPKPAEDSAAVGGAGVGPPPGATEPRPSLQEPPPSFAAETHGALPPPPAESASVPAASGAIPPVTSAATTPAAVPASAQESLRTMALPIAGLKEKDIRDMFADRRGAQGERGHEAIDIMAPIGTPVRAVADGTVRKLFLSKPGGITLYQFDPSEQIAYYYAHLDRYADGIKEGMSVRKGELIGYVGITGNSDPNGPHLHFAVFLLGPEKKWWQGTPVNPYPSFRDALRRGG